MPLHPGHSDEVREKNIKEMIDSGHDPKQAVAASYASQRKYKKMADGGLVGHEAAADAIEEDEIEGQLSDSHRGLFELQEDSHLDEQLDSVPEHHEMLANALGEREHYGMDEQEKGHAGSDEMPEEVVSLPKSHFAEKADELLEKRKKAKMIKIAA